ncbi:endoglucanase A-like [Saccoglossus kowalevskii]
MIVQDDNSSCNYDYDEVLRKSLLFYEAQRSGVLPDNNRIPWRGDSAVNDSTPDGKDLSGGYYDAGDHLKLGLPMAYSATVLAWGFIQFEDAYEAAGEVDHMLENLRWFADYFIKCHTQEHEFYAHVGSVNGDHGYWGRAEDMTMDRPAYKVDEDNPGSDVVGGTAAALAAIAFVFKDRDVKYSAILVEHARELFTFADDFRGKYSVSIPMAAKVYDSTGYMDEIIWAACWLYKATNEISYLDRAILLFNGESFLKPYSFGWNDVTVGYRAMLLQLTQGTDLQDTSFKLGVTAKFLTEWLPGGSMPYTPKGLVFRDNWGSLRYATASAFIALTTAEAGVKKTAYRNWAKTQVDYVLGDTGRSFVVGYGVNPPVQPHHRGSSCPDEPAPCGVKYLGLAAPNPQVLYGAMVGGPDANDNYKDARKDYFKNEVSLDFNAGFQSVVAGLRHLQLIGEL